MKDNTVSLSFQIENAEITLLFSSNGPIQDIDAISHKPEITLCHSHPVHEMFIVMSGEMIFTDNIKDILLKTRDVCIVPPGLFHTTYFPEKRTANTKRISIFFIYKKIKNENTRFDFYSMLNLLSLDGSGPMVTHISETFLSVLLDVLSGAQGGSGISPIMEVQTKNILSLIFIDMLKSLNADKSPENELYTRSNEYYKRIVTINERLNSKTGTTFSVAEIAKELEVTPRHLNNIFNDEYGTSVKNYSYTLRMRQAAFLLSYFPKLGINDIAVSLGYATSEIFSIMFRRYYGVSASEYRKKHAHTIRLEQMLPPEKIKL